MPIYLDVLIALNIFINYFILLCARKISSVPTTRLRLVLASILGGAFSVIIILPPTNIFLSILIKFSTSFAITATAFCIKSFKQFFRCFASFFLMNFAFAGVMLALWFLLKPNGMSVNNGMVYFNINILFFTSATIICYITISAIFYFTKRKAPSNMIYSISISIDNKNIVLKALLDTGNSLSDSFSGKPVTIAEFSSLKAILPTNFWSNDLPFDFQKRVGVVPLNTVSGDGILKTFRADKMIISDNNNKRIYIEKPIVAVSEASISNGEYTALLNPKILEGGEEKNEKIFAFSKKNSI